MVEDEEGFRPDLSRVVVDEEGFAAGFYAALRAADAPGVERIFVVPPTSGELLEAVLDRLRKAAGPREAAR